MADHGAIGRLDPYPAGAGLITQVGPGYVRCLIAGSGIRDPMLLSYYDGASVMSHVVRSGRDDSVGNLTPPSQIQGRWGAYTTLVPLTSGARTIAIDVLIGDHDGSDLSLQVPHPRLTVKANPEVGLLADVFADAVAQVGWQTLTVAFTATLAGAVEVWREKRYKGMNDVVHWDNLRVT